MLIIIWNNYYVKENDLVITKWKTGISVDKEKIKIEILNGSGSSVKLERIENRLKKAGYTDITTEETSNVDNSVIINRGDVENSAIEELKLLVQTQTVSVGESTDVNITIILGKDK